MTVTRLELTARGPYAGGQSFGDAGPYEMLQGRLYFAVDPDHHNNRQITDLALAPRNGAGKVEFSADFQLLKPSRPRPHGRLLYDAVNRGNKTVGRFNMAQAGQPPSSDPPVGDGFLMRRGFTLAWCGWQPDVPDQPAAMRSYLPAALIAGRRITGQAFLQFQPSARAYVQMLSDAGHRPLPTADLTDPDAVLTVRDYHDGPATLVPRSDWRFAQQDASGHVSPDVNFVHYASGFEPGKVYEITYNTIGATVMGLGLVATRDCLSWLRYADANSGNPVAGSIDHVYGFGVSLTARYLREYLYLGLNEDEEGRQVFDGLLTAVGSSRRGEFNFRFAQPSTNIARAPGNSFPFSYVTETDPKTGKSGGLLQRTRKQGRMLKLIAVNSGMEYWWSGASLQHIDVTGSRDLEVPEDVRLYLYCGTQHASGALPLTDRMLGGFRTANLVNTVDYHPMLRAALINLDQWVREGTAPPPNNVPSVGAGTAVERKSLEPAIRSIPGAGFPNHLPRRPRLDFGPEAGRGIICYPPSESEDYTVLVSKLDADCNDLGGVRPVDLRVPLATHTGWNLRHHDVGQPGEYVSGPLPGSTLPFARNRAEQEQSGDPRPSIEDRYAGKDAYLTSVRAAAQAMVGEGHLLAEDIPVVEQQASDRWDAFLNR